MKDTHWVQLCKSDQKFKITNWKRFYLCLLFFFLILTYTSFPSRNSWILISCQVILLSCHCECKTTVPASYFFYPAPYFFYPALKHRTYLVSCRQHLFFCCCFLFCFFLFVCFAVTLICILKRCFTCCLGCSKYYVLHFMPQILQQIPWEK